LAYPRRSKRDDLFWHVRHVEWLSRHVASVACPGGSAGGVDVSTETTPLYALLGDTVREATILIAAINEWLQPALIRA
jgi:hypothetical protein